MSPATLADTPDLAIAKTHTGDFQQAQTGATYTITVTNDGSAATSGIVTVTDTLPAALTATAIDGGATWTCTLATLVCTTTDSLAPTLSYPPITLTVDVSADAPDLVTNSVVVSGGGDETPENNTTTDPTAIVQLPDLVVTKTHTGDFHPGQTGATYTITVTNEGAASTSETITVTDTLPAGITATAIDGGATWTCTLATLVCTTTDSLAPSLSHPPITLTVDVSEEAAAIVTNMVSVAGGVEQTLANNTASDPTNVGFPDLTIAKTHSGSFVRGQTDAMYTITITNVGGAETTAAITITDDAPTGLSPNNIVNPGWNCALGFPSSCTRDEPLGAGASVAIAFGVFVQLESPLLVTNTATVSGGGDTNLENNVATDPTTIRALPDLVVTKTHTDTLVAGRSGTFTITVQNIGGGPTIGAVSVQDILPTGLTTVAMSGDGWSCTLATSTCTRADTLGAGLSYPSISLTAAIAESASGFAANEARVSTTPESNVSNNNVFDAFPIQQAPELSVTIDEEETLFAGEVALYAINIKNVGGPILSDLTLTMNWPQSLDIVSLHGGGLTCSTPPQRTCTYTGTLLTGTTLVVHASGDVLVDAPRSVTFTATVAGGGDEKLANNTARLTSTVEQFDMLVDVRHTGRFRRGAPAQFEVIVANGGTLPPGDVVEVTVIADPTLESLILSGTGWTCGTTTCTRPGTVASGAAFPAIAVDATVSAGAPDQISVFAELNDDPKDMSLENDHAMDFAGVDPATGIGGTTVSATAVSASRVDVSWDAVPGAAGYLFFRFDGTSQVNANAGMLTSFSDTSVRPNQAYIYTIRPLIPGGGLGPAASDFAVTVAFDEGTGVLASEIVLMRSALELVRTMIQPGSPPKTYTHAVAPGRTVRARDFAELREGIKALRALASLPAIRWTPPAIAAGMPILKTHRDTLLNALR